jgi:hypothetical protein
MGTDRPIQEHIEALVAEEHRLLDAHGGGGLSSDEHARLEQVGVELDRLCGICCVSAARAATPAWTATAPPSATPVPSGYRG